MLPFQSTGSEQKTWTKITPIVYANDALRASKFGNSYNCSEIVLEMVYTVFKECLDQNTHHDAQLRPSTE